MSRRTEPLGGVIHTYQGYDPRRFPSPTAPPPDLASGAFEHLMMYGNTRRLTEEELARAVRIDPSQIKGLGPSLEALIAMLEQRKRRILQTYETATVQKRAARRFADQAGKLSPPPKHAQRLANELAAQHLRGLEDLWYRLGDDHSPFALALMKVIERLGEKFEVDQLAANYAFTGHESLDVPKAIEIKEELEAIDRLLEQLRKAMETAQIGVIDMEELAEFASQEEITGLQALERQVQEYIRQLAEQQGLERAHEGYRLGPQALRLFQGRLLQTLFEHLQAARSGRHIGPIVGEGVVELPQTKIYEFGDSVATMDIPQSMINAMVREAAEARRRHPAAKPVRNGVHLRPEDIEIHRTRNTPKCATVVILDMSGSMRHGGQYIHCKRMALALDGLIRREYPGDTLRFVEMYTFARPRHVSEIPSLMPKPVTIYEPIVRLRADMSDPRITDLDIPAHFTNIQRALQMARTMLQDAATVNQQIILITDGLPTAHFEDHHLFMLYPADARTEQATMREAMLCARQDIRINVFLLPNWGQTSEDIQFAHRMVETTRGRVFFTAGKDLDRFVLWDYVSNRRSIIA